MSGSEYMIGAAGMDGGRRCVRVKMRVRMRTRMKTRTRWKHFGI